MPQRAIHANQNNAKLKQQQNRRRNDWKNILKIHESLLPNGNHIIIIMKRSKPQTIVRITHENGYWREKKRDFKY